MPWVDGIRGKIFLEDKSEGNRGQCNKICTRDFLNDNCSNQCMSQMSEKSYEHVCDDDKCLVSSVEGKCGLKVLDVGCSVTECGSQDSQTKTYAIGGKDLRSGSLMLLESKAGDLYSCHRWCEDQISAWNPAGRGLCKVQCNNRYPTDGQQCDELFGKGQCNDECRSAMSIMHKLYQERAAEMDTYDSMSV